MLTGKYQSKGGRKQIECSRGREVICFLFFFVSSSVCLFWDFLVLKKYMVPLENDLLLCCHDTELMIDLCRCMHKHFSTYTLLLHGITACVLVAKTSGCK